MYGWICDAISCQQLPLKYSTQRAEVKIIANNGIIVCASNILVFFVFFVAVVVEVALILKCATLDLHKNTLTHSAATSKSRCRAASAAPECKQEAPLIRAAEDDTRLLLPAGPLQTEARESGRPRETQTTPRAEA